MNFINQLVESEHSKKFKIHIVDYRHFNPIRIDDELSMSVQASRFNYCVPRFIEITLENLNEYESMEVSLLKNNRIVQVKDVLPTFSRLKEIEEYLIDNTVYGFVPLYLIEQLYNELIVKFCT